MSDSEKWALLNHNFGNLSYDLLLDSEKWALLNHSLSCLIAYSFHEV